MPELESMDYLYLFLSLVASVVLAFAYYRVLLRSWVSRLRHPRHHRWIAAWWGVGLLVGMVSLALWTALSDSAGIELPVVGLIPGTLLFYVVWVPVMLVLYLRARIPVSSVNR